MPPFLLGLGLGDDPMVPVPLDLPVLLGFVPLDLVTGVPAEIETELDGVAGLTADATLPGVAVAVGHAPNGLAIGITFCCCCLLFEEEGVAGAT